MSKKPESVDKYTLEAWWGRIWYTLWCGHCGVGCVTEQICQPWILFAGLRCQHEPITLSSHLSSWIQRLVDASGFHFGQVRTCKNDWQHASMPKSVSLVERWRRCYRSQLVPLGVSCRCGVLVWGEISLRYLTSRDSRIPYDTIKAQVVIGAAEAGLLEWYS